MTNTNIPWMELVKNFDTDRGDRSPRASLREIKELQKCESQ